MIKKIVVISFLVLVLSCGSVELVLKEGLSNPLKNNILLFISGDDNGRYNRELYSFFGNSDDNEYILVTSFSEKKEKRVVKQNQVAEKIDYEIIITYELFYMSKECSILNKKIATKFTATSKSFGYNFGADRSFEKLYTSTIKNNIQKFLRSVPISKDCIK